MKTVSGQKNSKVSKLDGAKGGNHAMLKRQHTGTQKPGVSSQEQGSSSGDGAQGGSTKMFGKQTVKAAKPA